VFVLIRNNLICFADPTTTNPPNAFDSVTQGAAAVAWVAPAITATTAADPITTKVTIKARWAYFSNNKITTNNVTTSTMILHTHKQQIDQNRFKLQIHSDLEFFRYVAFGWT
jgi:hypothetical protein